MLGTLYCGPSNVSCNVEYHAFTLHFTVITVVMWSIMLPERNVPIESLGDLANAMQGNIIHLYF